MGTQAPPKPDSRPKAKRDDGGRWGGRTYTLPATDTLPEEKVPSVTTILGVINKPALVGWAANMERAAVLKTALDLHDDLPVNAPKMSRMAYENTLLSRLTKEKAWSKELSKQGEIGTQIHSLIEWNLKKELNLIVGAEPVVKDKALWGFMVYEEWRKKVNFIPRYIEQQLWSRKHKYAGTADWIGSVDGVDTLGDWKSGKAIYDEALMQVAAYIMAMIEMGHAEAPMNGCIVRLPKVETDPEPEVKIIPWSEIPYLFKGFMAARELFAVTALLKSEEPIPAIELPQEKVERGGVLDVTVAEEMSKDNPGIPADISARAEASDPNSDGIPLPEQGKGEAERTEAQPTATEPVGGLIMTGEVVASAVASGVSVAPVSDVPEDEQQNREEYTAWYLDKCVTNMPKVKRAREALHHTRVEAAFLTKEQRDAFRLTVEDYIKQSGQGRNTKRKKSASRK